MEEEDICGWDEKTLDVETEETEPRCGGPRGRKKSLVLSLASGPWASKLSITVLFQEAQKAVILNLDWQLDLESSRRQTSGCVSAGVSTDVWLRKEGPPWCEGPQPMGWVLVLTKWIKAKGKLSMSCFLSAHKLWAAALSPCPMPSCQDGRCSQLESKQAFPSLSCYCHRSLTLITIFVGLLRPIAIKTH